MSNAWITCLSQGDSSWKRLVIPHTLFTPHGAERRDLSVKDGSASDEPVGGVTAHQSDDQ